jgi:hypothetical protein
MSEEKDHHQQALPTILSFLEKDDEDDNKDDDADDDDDDNDTTTSLWIQQQRMMHWILHFDINETILVGDESGGDTRDHCFHKMIAKSAFVQRTPRADRTDDDDDDNDDTSTMTPTHWWDGSPLAITDSSSRQQSISRLPPPPLYTGWKWPRNCCPYYRTRYKPSCNHFCHPDHPHGSMYEPSIDVTPRPRQFRIPKYSSRLLSNHISIGPSA